VFAPPPFRRQGAAESIAMETAKERTKLFERISQSDEFAAEYERQREALHKAKDDTQFHYYRKKTATAERKQVSREKQEARRGVPGLGVTTPPLGAQCNLCIWGCYIALFIHLYILKYDITL